jgi:hypothetical protein
MGGGMSNFDIGQPYEMMIEAAFDDSFVFVYNHTAFTL